MKNEQRHLWYLSAMACMSILWFTQTGMGLVVSEIMYHPTDAGGTLEFIELYNNRAVFEDLTNYAFTNGIQYVFKPGTIIRPKSSSRYFVQRSEEKRMNVMKSSDIN